MVPGQQDDLSQLVEKADQALYRAKEHGRNRTVTWEPVVFPDADEAP